MDPVHPGSHAFTVPISSGVFTYNSRVGGPTFVTHDGLYDYDIAALMRELFDKAIEQLNALCSQEQAKWADLQQAYNALRTIEATLIDRNCRAASRIVELVSSHPQDKSSEVDPAETYALPTFQYSPFQRHNQLELSKGRFFDFGNPQEPTLIWSNGTRDPARGAALYEVMQAVSGEFLLRLSEMVKANTYFLVQNQELVGRITKMKVTHDSLNMAIEVKSTPTVQPPPLSRLAGRVTNGHLPAEANDSFYRHVKEVVREYLKAPNERSPLTAVLNELLIRPNSGWDLVFKELRGACPDMELTKTENAFISALQDVFSQKKLPTKTSQEVLQALYQKGVIPAVNVETCLEFGDSDSANAIVTKAIRALNSTQTVEVAGLVDDIQRLSIKSFGFAKVRILQLLRVDPKTVCMPNIEDFLLVMTDRIREEKPSDFPEWAKELRSFPLLSEAMREKFTLLITQDLNDGKPVVQLLDGDLFLRWRRSGSNFDFFRAFWKGIKLVDLTNPIYRSELYEGVLSLSAAGVERDFPRKCMLDLLRTYSRLLPDLIQFSRDNNAALAVGGTGDILWEVLAEHVAKQVRPGSGDLERLCPEILKIWVDWGISTRDDSAVYARAFWGVIATQSAQAISQAPNEVFEGIAILAQNQKWPTSWDRAIFSGMAALVLHYKAHQLDDEPFIAFWRACPVQAKAPSERADFVRAVIAYCPPMASEFDETRCGTVLPLLLAEWKSNCNVWEAKTMAAVTYQFLHAISKFFNFSEANKVLLARLALQAWQGIASLEKVYACFRADRLPYKERLMALTEMSSVLTDASGEIHPFVVKCGTEQLRLLLDKFKRSVKFTATEVKVLEECYVAAEAKIASEDFGTSISLGLTIVLARFFSVARAVITQKLFTSWETGSLSERHLIIISHILNGFETDWIGEKEKADPVVAKMNRLYCCYYLLTCVKIPNDSGNSKVLGIQCEEEVLVSMIGGMAENSHLFTTRNMLDALFMFIVAGLDSSGVLPIVRAKYCVDNVQDDEAFVKDLMHFMECVLKDRKTYAPTIKQTEILWKWLAQDEIFAVIAAKQSTQLRAFAERLHATTLILQHLAGAQNTDNSQMRAVLQKVQIIDKKEELL